MKPGDTMIRVHYHHSATRVTVRTVGRKWLTVGDGERYDLATLTAESGGYSLRTPGQHAEEQDRAGLRASLRDMAGAVNRMPTDRVRRLIAALEEKV